MPVSTYKNARKELEAYGFIQRFGVRRLPYIYVGSVLCTTLAVLILFPNSGPMATAVVAAGVFLLGFQQWRAARYEVSLDKYYDRLEKADERLEKWPHARKMLAHFWQGSPDDISFQKLNYVYVELDNLEYVIEKYKLGYISAEQALRGLHTFRSRCLSDEFREIASTCIDSLEYIGYYETTAQVVRRVCASIDTTSMASQFPVAAAALGQTPPV